MARGCCDETVETVHKPCGSLFFKNKMEMRCCQRNSSTAGPPISGLERKRPPPAGVVFTMSGHAPLFRLLLPKEQVRRNASTRRQGHWVTLSGVHGVLLFPLPPPR